MFTDRFIRVPIKLLDKKQEELTGKTELEDSYSKILPSDLAQYRPVVDHENENEGNPFIHIGLKSGDRFFVYMSIKEFETLLNNHQTINYAASHTKESRY